MSVLRKHTPAWNIIWRELGVSTATPIGRMSRDDAIKTLRHEYVWSLEKIGNAFGITRERVRQIAGTSQTAKHERLIATQSEVNRCLTIACRDKSAWTSTGKLSKQWLKAKLKPRIIEANLNDDEFSKFQVVLSHGLKCKTEDRQREQLHKWQFCTHYYSYEDIAKMLSRRFVPISVMSVFRGAEAIGHKGHSTGAPGQARHFSTDSEV